MTDHISNFPPMRPAVSESLAEQLSSLCDGELAGEQVRFLLRGVQTQADLTRRWSNYHLIGATLRREFVAVELPADFSAGIWAAVERDAQMSAAVAPAGGRRRGMAVLRWAGGGAIAAAVAVVALTTSHPAGVARKAAAPVAVAAAPVAAGNAATGSVYQTAPANGSLPLQTFDAGAVMPASFDAGMEGYPLYWGPRGLTVPQAPYRLRAAEPAPLVAPVQLRELQNR